MAKSRAGPSVHEIPRAVAHLIAFRLALEFDLDAPVSEIGSALSSDRTLKALLRKNPGVRVPGAWDGFEITIRTILGQQISAKAATTIAGRIA
mgnify:CR=1 FL=1